MKLIQELQENVELIVENKLGKDKKYIIEGIFLQSNLKNKNNRIYPEHIMDAEVDRYIKENVDTNTAYGELSHPKSPTINEDRISHLITSLKKEGTNWIGRATVLNTPMGNIVKGIMEGGGKLGISSRALGSLKMNNEGVSIVQDDFLISTAGDIVSSPSGPNCWIGAIMEDVEWAYIPGIGFERIKHDINAIYKSTKYNSKDRDTKLTESFTKFLSMIK